MLNRMFHVAVQLAPTLAALLYVAMHPPLANRLVRIARVEKLDRPTAVEGWDSAGLILVDGRHLPLPGMDALPPQSANPRKSDDAGRGD